MERAVVVTTEFRGVFFGYIGDGDTSQKTLKLSRARNCLYWPVENHGFLGLASIGPLPGSRVGPAVNIELRSVTCVADCTPEAVKKWESEPWS